MVLVILPEVTDLPEWLTGGDLGHASALVQNLDGSYSLTGAAGLSINEGVVEVNIPAIS